MNRFFAYYWIVDEKETEFTAIRIYGLDENNKNVCVRINDFQPFCFVELPENIKEVESRIIINKIKENIDPDEQPASFSLVMKKKLYYANMKGGKYKEYPFIFFSFKHEKHLRSMVFRVNKLTHIPGIGRINLKVHETEAKPILQLTSLMEIPTAGWIEFKDKSRIKIMTGDDKLTTCDTEIKVSYKNLKSCSSEHLIAAPLCLSYDIEVNSSIPSAMPNSARDADKVFQLSAIFWRYGEDIEKDCIKYLLTLGNPVQEIVGVDVNILNYSTEAELLIGFTDLINQLQPNVIMGYNIFTFDIPYMLERAKYRCGNKFAKMGFTDTVGIEREISWSSSAYKNQTYKYLDAEGRLFVDLLPIIRRDHAKFDSYSLKKVSTFFLGVTKDPLDAKGIFQCYRDGMKAEDEKATEKEIRRGRKALGIVGKYCVQDSMLVMRLFKVLNIWTGITEMARVCNVSIFATYTQGQQLRVFSQLYKKCIHDDIVIDKKNYQDSSNDEYVGASVHKPTKHYFTNVLPFDFTSLYPTTIIAYNICWSTLVRDYGKSRKDENVKDSECNIMEWEDHVNCEHDPSVISRRELDIQINKINEEVKKCREVVKKLKGLELEYVKNQILKLKDKLKPLQKQRREVVKGIGKRIICGERYFRWLKEPKGILPTIASNLLESRRNTKKEMKAIKSEMSKFQEFSSEWNILNTQYNVLDARQLALKVSCNSLYGALGVAGGKGYCPLMPGAMCTTYQGRMAIKKTIDMLTNKYKGELCHSDTDSAYCSFPFLNSPQECWEFAMKVAKEISAFFPKPMEILYEEHIYQKFLILTKKRYMSIEIDKDGKSKLDEDGKPEINKKGVLLTRRDNCEFVRHVYANVVIMIFDGKSKEEILLYIIDEINKLMSHSYDIDMFRTTKSVGDIGDLENVKELEESGKMVYKMGDYKVKLLSSDPDEMQEQMESKNAETVQEYYLNCLPAQCVLAYKLNKDRGQLIHAGERIEYVIVETNKKNPTQRDSIESYQYAKRHLGIVKLDYFHYFHKLSTPIDQILGLMYGAKYEDFCLNQYKYRLKVREAVLNEIRSISKPIIKFI